MASGTARSELGWPMTLSLLLHALLVPAALLLPHTESARPSYVPVTLEVVPRPKTVPPPPASAPPPKLEVHRPVEPRRRGKPRARPKPRREERARQPAPAPETAPPEPRPAPSKLAHAHAPREAVPGASRMAGVAASGTGPGLDVPAGDPHGSPHGHPHAVGGGGVAEPEPLPPPAPPPPPPPPPRAAPRRPVPLRELSRLPVLLSLEKRYPREARAAGVEGRVVLVVLIDERGRVREVRVRKGLGFGCVEAAREALLKSRWAPGLDRAGKPVPTRVLFSYDFVLD